MKKTLVIVFSIFLVSAVTAISTDLKTSYERGETAIAEIKGEIIGDLEPSQVDFRRGHISVPFDYDLKKIGDKYFLWFSASDKENNYTLSIKDIVTTVSGRGEIINFEQNFSVSGNLTDYSIKPGFISTQKDFEVIVQLNEDSDKEISVDFPAERKIVLRPGRNNIIFSIKDISESNFININIGKYVFPAYIIFKNLSEENRSSIDEIILKINPESIKSKVLKGGEAVYPFQLINIGKARAENVIFEYDKELFYIPEAKITLEPEKAMELNISYIGTLSETINESILIKAGEYFIELPIEIEFTEKKEEVKTPYLDDYEKLDYCSELKGRVCTGGEKCSGESKIALDTDACCVGECKKEEGSSNSWIGYVVAGVILGIIVFVFLKYRKAKGTDGFKKTLTAAEKKFP